MGSGDGVSRARAARTRHSRAARARACGARSRPRLRVGGSAASPLDSCMFGQASRSAPLLPLPPRCAPSRRSSADGRAVSPTRPASRAAVAEAEETAEALDLAQAIIALDSPPERDGRLMQQPLDERAGEGVEAVAVGRRERRPGCGRSRQLALAQLLGALP